MSTVPLYTGEVPKRTQSQVDFNQNVGDILDYQVTLAPAINIVAGEINTNATNAATSETNAAASATEAAASANATVYDNGTTYNYPDSVIASDGLVYRCLGTGIIGDDPATSVTGEWIVPNLDRERTIHTTGSGLPNELEDLAVKITPTVLAEGQDWAGIAYTDPDAIGANPTALIYPDGTVVGSTDNGSYTKHPDGGLNVWHTLSFTSTTITLLGSVYYQSVGDIVLFPIAFNLLTQPAQLSTSPLYASGRVWSTHTGLGSLQATLVMIGATSGNTGNHSFRAIGRWK